MAIDTENKRRSALGCWAACRILPVPSSGIDAADRAHLFVYDGLAEVGGGGVIELPPGAVILNRYALTITGRWIVTELAIVPAETTVSWDAVHLTGIAHVTDLGAGALPSPAYYHGGRAYTGTGVACVTTAARVASDQFLGGIAVRNDGAMRVTTADVEASDQFLDGRAVSNDGVVRVSMVT